MRRMCVVFYAALTAAALLVAAPVMAVAFHWLGSSAWAEELTANLSVQWIGELIAGHAGLSAMQLALVLAGVFAISLMVDLFLLGGALHLFSRHERFSMPAFFAGCGRNFGGLIRLGLISLIFYGAAWLLWYGLSSLGDALWGEGSAATPLVYWSWFSAAGGLCLFGLVNLVFDYARIQIVVAEGPSAWRGTILAARFVRSHWRSTVSLYGSLWLTAALGAAAYFGMARLLRAPAIAAVTLLLLVRQAAVFGKVCVRLLFYAAQFEMFDALTPRPFVPEAELPPELPEAVLPADAEIVPENE